MTQEIVELERYAGDLLKTALSAAPSENGQFRFTACIVFGGRTKSVLVVGNAHADFQDGNAIAVINPDKELGSGLQCGTAYGHGALKSLVNGHCDAMVQVFLRGGSEQQVRRSNQYRARLTA